MPLTEEENQAEWNLKESGIKKAEAERLTREYRENIQKGRVIEREQAAVDRAADAKDEITGELLWDIVRKDAEALISEGPAGFNDWSIGTAKLISHALKIAKATANAPIFPFRDEIVGGLNFAGDFVWDNTFGRAGDAIFESRLKAEDFPKFNISTRIDEQGSLDINITRDGKDATKDPEMEDLVNHLRTGVTAWAKTQGYELKKNDAAPGQCFKTDPGGVKMTNEKLGELNADPEKGLEKFLSGRFEMPSLTSSISP